MSVRLACLGLFIMVLGIDFGAGLYEARIEVPRWLEWSEITLRYTWNADVAREADVGRKFWVFATTLPLTLITIGGFVLAQGVQNPARKWWNLGLVLALIERAFTFTFFIPTMMRLAAPGTVSDPQTVATALLWRNMNGLRHLLTLSAWLCALRALYLWESSMAN